MAKILEGLRYSESHEYVKIEGDCAVVGITDFAQEQLGNVVYVDVPEVGDEVTAGETFGAVESTKAASDLVCPVSGEVVEGRRTRVGKQRRFWGRMDYQGETDESRRGRTTA